MGFEVIGNGKEAVKYRNQTNPLTTDTFALPVPSTYAAQRSAIALFLWLQLGLGSPPPRVRAASSIVSFLRELKTTYLFLQSFSLV